MTINAQQLETWLAGREDEHLDFKEARANYSFDKLVGYCAALANEGGGAMVLGVTDKQPRHVVGTGAFQDPGKVCQGLLDRLHLRIRAEEIAHPDGRVLVFTVPRRPLGMPIEVDGTYWMRTGESLTGMTPDVLRRIFDEVAPDFSAETCPGATLDDLDPSAIVAFQQAWARKAGNRALEKLAPEQALEDSELVEGGRVTYAALVLFGKRRSLGRLPEPVNDFETATFRV